MSHQLAEDFALEIAMLETAFPPRWDRENAIVDLRGDTACIYERIADVVGFAGREMLAEDAFLPLLFGAAWKVLDIIVERGLQLEDPRQVRPQIATKVKRAQDTKGADFVPLLLRTDIAVAVAELYAKTHELRHSVVHRRVDRDAYGTLFGKDATRLSKAEATAFCELVLIVGRCASMPMDRRAQSHAAWLANLLYRVHEGQALLDAHRPRPIDVVVVAAAPDGDRWIVNTERAHRRVAATGYPFAWLEVRAPAGEFPIWRGRLEEIPDDARAVFILGAGIRPSEVGRSNDDECC